MRKFCAVSGFVLNLVFTSLLFLCFPQPNKVYIGGLPENTRQEDLQNCFEKIGNIVNIELKSVYILFTGVWLDH